VYKLNPDMFVKASHQPRTCIRPEVASIVASGAIRSTAEATVVAVDQGPRFPDSESTAPSLLSQNTGLFIGTFISSRAGKYVDHECIGLQARAGAICGRGQIGQLHVSTAPGFISTSTSAYPLLNDFPSRPDC
jgi:hypothetical protein